MFGPVRVRGSQGNSVCQSQGFEVDVHLRLDSNWHGFILFCRLEDMHGRLICLLREESSRLGIGDGSEGNQLVKVQFPALWLNPGLYSLDFVVAFLGEYHSEEIATSDKFPLDVEGASFATDSRFRSEPVLNPNVTWSIQGNTNNSQVISVEPRATS